MPPKRKFPKPKWKRGLCQQRGCRLHVKGRTPLCEQHLSARKAGEVLADGPPKP
jgi:hypothetical protein